MRKSIFHDKDLSSQLYDFYIEKLKNHTTIKAKDELELFREYNNGSLEARNKIIINNLKSIISIAKKYSSDRAELNDFIQEATVKLIENLDTFDYKKGFRFYSYYNRGVFHSLENFNEKINSLISIPYNMIPRLKRYRNFAYDFYKEHGRGPTEKEIINGLGISYEELCNFNIIINEIDSLDYPVSEEDNELLSECVEDKNLEYLEEIAYKNELKDIIEEMLESLDERDRDIIKKYFGIGCEKQTFKEIGEYWGVTASCIGLRKDNSLSKLKKLPATEKTLFVDTNVQRKRTLK